MSYYGTNQRQIRQYIRVEAQEYAWFNQQAGVAVNQFDVVYLDGGFWLQADAYVPNRARPPVGVVAMSAASGGVTAVVMQGLVSNGNWSLQSGQRVWLASGTPGNIVTSAPAGSGVTQLLLGWSPTPTQVEFHPDQPNLVAGV